MFRDGRPGLRLGQRLGLLGAAVVTFAACGGSGPFVGTLHVAFSNGASGDADFRLNYCLRDGGTLTTVDGSVDGHGVTVAGLQPPVEQLSLHVGYAPTSPPSGPPVQVPVPIDVVVVDLSQTHVLTGFLHVPPGSAVPTMWHADVSGGGLHMSLDASGSC